MLRGVEAITGYRLAEGKLFTRGLRYALISSAVISLHSAIVSASRTRLAASDSSWVRIQSRIVSVTRGFL